MDVAIVGAFGAVGREFSAQILSSKLLDSTCRLQLVGHRGHSSEREMYGLRSDLADAFIEDAPVIEVGVEPEFVDADVVVMLAGMTIPRTVDAPFDRSQLAATNHEIFRSYAEALETADREVTVVVQSNPVELGVQVFAEHLDRHRVLGAGAWNDTLRFRRELAREFGVQRADVSAAMLGEHGTNLVPLWSQVRVRGFSAPQLAEAIGAIRSGRDLAAFPDEVLEARAAVLDLVVAGDIPMAYAVLEALSPDLRTVVKPFFIHFTSGSTTQMATAHAVIDVLEALRTGDSRVISAQVSLAGEWADRHGVVGAQVVLDGQGWTGLVDMDLAGDEETALHEAVTIISGQYGQYQRPSRA